MTKNGRLGLFSVLLGVAAGWPLATRGQAPAPAPAVPYGLPLVGAEAEEFLKTARVVDRTPIGKGVTRPDRLTLTDGSQTHRGIWKTINEHKMGLQHLEGGGRSSTSATRGRARSRPTSSTSCSASASCPRPSSDASTDGWARSRCGSKE